MATAIENLNLEEGKSEALRAVLAGIAESKIGRASCRERV